MTGWQWRQLDQMQIICTSPQTDNHTSIPHQTVFLITGRMPFLPRQKNEGTDHTFWCSLTQAVLEKEAVKTACELVASNVKA